MLGRYAVVPAGSIDTREELIAGLALASTLEQSLLVQYLFAAYSLRKRPGPGLDERQVELVRDWEATLLEVAREEMVHFATVTKIAVAVGGSPQLDRPRLPQAAGDAFPFGMRLRRFGPAEATEAVAFELAPDVLEYEYLGEMYRQIVAGIELLAAQHGEEWLFVGPTELRNAENWGLNHVVRAITDASSAVAAVDEIITEGEGGPADTPNSHWRRFLRVRDELAAELRAQPDFAPAHPVADSPVTRAQGEAEGTVLQGLARAVAEVFNHVYATVLLLIGQYYAPAGETDAQREQVQATVRRSMSAILRPLAEVLTELPAGGEGDSDRAGAPFETYGAIAPAPSSAARWAVIDERLERAAAEAARLAADAQLPRMRFIAENLALMHAGIRRVSTGAGVGVARPRV
jgi:hypothetical protein